MFNIDAVLLLVGGLLLVCIALNRLTSKISVPALVIFLFVGLFLDLHQFFPSTIDNYNLVQSISIVALIIIMFSGGLDTDFTEVKPILWQGISLSTFGVFITTMVLGIMVHLLFNIDLLTCMLLAAIVSSTDAAAVFSIFKTQNLKIKNKLDSILELESATNDPMAYILVISIMYLVIHPETSMSVLIFDFFKSLALGLISGYILGKLFARTLTIINLEIEGLYPVLLLASALLSFSITETIGGNGFLAVYISAVLIGNTDIKNKQSQMSFFDGIAWVMQILMFVLLGAFTSINDLIPKFIPAILIAMILIFVARPIAIFVSLAPFKLDLNSRTFLSWAGIKGAVPIVFAFYPLVYGVPDAQLIFDIVMVITCLSVLIQGSSLKFMAEKLKVLIL